MAASGRLSGSEPIRAAAAPVPPLDALRPMLLAERQVRPFDSEEFYEVKLDGYRLLAEFGAGHGASLRTRGGAAAERWFPEVVLGLDEVGAAGRCVVDGEVVVFDADGRCDFDQLHWRALRRRYFAGAPLVVYCMFDILVLNGEAVMDKPAIERKEMLRALVGGSAHPALQFVEHFSGTGRALYGAAVRMSQEGIVAKRAESRYAPNSRTADWLKIKRPGAVPPGRFRRGA